MFGLFKSSGGSGFGGVERSAGGKSKSHPSTARKTGVENRRGPRYTPRDIKVRLDGKQLELADISGLGLFMRGAPGWLASGQALIFEIAIPAHGQVAYVATQGRVVRKATDGVGIRYRKPHPNWDKMISNYLG